MLRAGLRRGGEERAHHSSSALKSKAPVALPVALCPGFLFSIRCVGLSKSMRWVTTTPGLVATLL